MASVELLWTSIVNQINSAMATSTLTPGAVAIDWPNVDILQAVATKRINPVIAVFDRGGARNDTKAMILNPALPYNFGSPGGVLTPSANEVGDTQTVTVTGSGTPIVYDAFFVAFTQWSTEFFAEYICNSADTLTSALTNLTTAINNIGGGSQFSASRSGSTITITNNSGQNLPVRAAVLNVGSYTQEIGRWDRELQIVLWTSSPTDRETYGTPLEQLFFILESNYGLQLSDQSRCRILVKDDYVCKDTQLQDLYRRDWILSCDYPILQVLPAWVIAALHLVYDAQA